MVVRLVKVEKFGCICYNIPIELIFIRYLRENTVYHLKNGECKYAPKINRAIPQANSSIFSGTPYILFITPLSKS